MTLGSTRRPLGPLGPRGGAAPGPRHGPHGMRPPRRRRSRLGRPGRRCGLGLGRAVRLGVTSALPSACAAAGGITSVSPSARRGRHAVGLRHGARRRHNLGLGVRACRSPPGPWPPLFGFVGLGGIAAPRRIGGWRRRGRLRGGRLRGARRRRPPRPALRWSVPGWRPPSRRSASAPSPALGSGAAPELPSGPPWCGADARSSGCPIGVFRPFATAPTIPADGSPQEAPSTRRRRRYGWVGPPRVFLSDRGPTLCQCRVTSSGAAPVATRSRSAAR